MTCQVRDEKIGSCFILFATMGANVKMAKTPGIPRTIIAKEKIRGGRPSNGAKTTTIKNKTILDRIKPINSGQKRPKRVREYNKTVVPASTISSSIITCRIGGETGGIPVIRDEMSGVKTATARIRGKSRKKAAAAMGQNMGRNTLPRPML